MTETDLTAAGELLDLRGATVVDRDGHGIGELEQLWVDNVNGLPEWAAVKTKRLLGSSVRYVPLRAADFGEDEVTVAYTKDEVKGAPDFDPHRASRDEVERLYRHYRQPLPAPPRPKVRNPFDRLAATWVPGVAEKAAAVGAEYPRPKS